MQRPEGERGRPRAVARRVLYVGEETRGAAVAGELFDSELRVERRGTEALDRIETDAVDCVVAEADLPDVDGAELLGAVGELRPDAARVLVAESVEDAPRDVAFVPTRPRADLPARTARRVERAAELRSAADERDRLADRVETLVEGTPDPILTVDEDCEVAFATRAVERVFGYDPDTIAGEPVRTLLADGEADRVAEVVESLAADSGPDQRDYVELTGRHRDGREVPLAVSIREAERDRARYFSAVVRDVNERERLADRLEAEKRKTRELHEVAVMLEESGSVEAACELAVETAEQLLEFDLCAVDTVEDGELVPQAVSRGVPTDGVYTTTPVSADDNLAARAYRAGRSIRTADLREAGVDPAASGYRAALTVPVGEVGVFQAVSKEVGAFDRSDRKLAELLTSHLAQSVQRIRSEAALEAERDRFAALFENTRDAIIYHDVVDGEPVIRSVNESFEAVFGYDAERVVGESVLDVLVPDEYAEEAKRHVDRMQRGDHVDAEVRRETATGVRDFQVRTAKVPDDATGGYVIYTDITDRKQLERDLTREKQKIEELHHVAVSLEGCDTPREIYRRTVDAAEEILKFDICGVDVEEDGYLVPKATSSELDETGYDVLRADEGLAGETYLTGRTFVVDDIHEVGDVEVVSDRYRSVLSVPFGDVGVLQAGAYTPGEFDEEDLRLAELLVAHAAEALSRVRSEEALRAERDRFAALFENVPEPTARYELRDGEPVVLSVNEAFEDVFGYDGEEALGASIDDILVPDGRREEAERLTERVRNGERIDAEVEREAVDGVRDFLVRNASVSGGDEHYVIYTDITERKRNAERHRSMTEDVMDNTDVGIFVLDDEFEVAWANSAVTEYFDLDRERVLGADKRSLIDAEIRDVVADDEAFVDTVTATYEDNSYVEEFTCHVTAGGDRGERHLHHRSRPIESGLYAGGRVELYYDVTERVRREEMLDALHGATRDLMAAGSQRDICRTAVDTAQNVLDIPYATVFRWDEERELLDPYIQLEDTVAELGAAPTLERGEGIVGTAFAEGEALHFDNAWDDPRAHENGAEGIRAFGAFPLGDWGVMTVASRAVGAFDDYEMDLVRVLAANAEVALNRAAREAELADQRCQLAELDRINAVIRDVDQLLVRAATREEILQAVCDRLAESDQYQFAWTGETMAGSDWAEPTTWAGAGEGYLDEIKAMHEETPRGPAQIAVETGEVQVVQSVPEDDEFAPWREAALERGYQSAAALPLRYRETVYGVLCVYADRANAFDDRERAVLAELGETIGHAINAAENKRALLTDAVVEVEFEIDHGEGFLARVPREEGGRFALEGVTMTAEGSFVYFVTADGLDPGTVLSRAEDADDVEQARLINEHDDGALFELVYTGPSPLTGLADHGGTLRHAEFTPEGGRSVVELPQNADVRSVVESIQEGLPGTSAAAQRERERPARTVEEFRTALGEDLTERQRSALEAAFYAGFFEWPRESTGEEVSESLGVSPPTFHQHLRVGERKLLSAFLDEE
ncbi:MULTISPECIES: GAF domain-containing protein [Halorussus]|uniref:GAF domain-containing protein n=1 Tax=Halorussus TaxID=1070314 RepID=UPI0013B46306|nr:MULTISPECIES: GAF domain-containing protein [Halorussus]NHN61283.1 GAF domain-containing protein [Halorussus sp. JP-T4]